VECIQLAQDIVQWLILMNTVINILRSMKHEEFLDQFSVSYLLRDGLYLVD
jgi:hypothetical protein